MSKFNIIRDQQEKKNYWEFATASFIDTVKVEHIKTGDYVIEGYEDLCAIERKGTIQEFSQNIYQKRFVKELERLEDIKYPFVILEFSMFDVYNFPATSTMPHYIKKKIKVKWYDIVRKLNEFQVCYKTKFILADHYGQQTAQNIFKRILEKESLL